MRDIMKIKSITLSILLAAATALCVVPSTASAASSGSQDMYRLYNPNSGEHFYTAEAAEKDHLVSVGWNFEGTGWVAPASSDTPVYRLYNKNAGVHHYSMSADERNYLVSIGWNDEGIGWYSDDERKVPLYRQYNPNNSQHNYTTNSGEHLSLIVAGWQDEQVGWYGIGEGKAVVPNITGLSHFEGNYVEATNNANTFSIYMIGDYYYFTLNLTGAGKISGSADEAADGRALIQGKDPAGNPVAMTFSFDTSDGGFYVLSVRTSSWNALPAGKTIKLLKQ